MKEYHKIETLFKRNMAGDKKLVEGEFRNPAIEYLKDNKWSFTEKVDGTNIRVHWDGHTVTFGGRTDNAQLPSSLVYALNDKFLGLVNQEIFEQQFGLTPVTLYGEGYGGGIQKGGGLYLSDAEKGFVLFDALINDKWSNRGYVEAIATAFNIPVVPVILEGTIQEAVDYVKNKPMSTIARSQRPSEGLIGRPMHELTDAWGNRIIVKIKVDDFIKD